MAEGDDLVTQELSPIAWGEAPVGYRPDPYPNEPTDLVADRGAHSAYLPISSLMDGDSEHPGARLGDPRRCGTTILEFDALAKVSEPAWRDPSAVHFDQVLLLHTR